MRRVEVPFVVYWGDADAAQLVFYPNVFRYVMQAEHELFSGLGFDTIRLMRERRLANPRVHVEADYHRPLWIFDRGTCQLWVSTIGRSSLRLDFALVKEGEAEPAVTGHMVQVFVDVDSMRPVPIPEELRRALEADDGG
ncbi:thioesterase family protein [Thermomicrobium sp. 4228-Ro]|uniref:acyl-CoA thioesterase n=1 Tax=Thermomicrobium sp. 4228-Ro TaxID=2993937 RepID=UPI0022497F9C|nr:thioesterase family protein [Thermomicrobium sp. 4228-Ro]MCX2728348.1 thioesterase family protein [Thermomicrobium sp. 4228-Ro]